MSTSSETGAKLEHMIPVLEDVVPESCDYFTGGYTGGYSNNGYGAIAHREYVPDGNILITMAHVRNNDGAYAGCSCMRIYYDDGTDTGDSLWLWKTNGSVTVDIPVDKQAHIQKVFIMSGQQFSGGVDYWLRINRKEWRPE